MLFEFKIYNRELIKVNDRHVVNIDAFNKCKFYFQKDIWDNKEIFVTFINEYGYSQVIMLGKWAEVLSCTIPDIFLKGKYFRIFVYSKDSFKTNTLKININKKTCSTSKTQRHEAINYLIDELKTKIDNIVFEDNQLKCYSNNKLVDTIFIDNVDESLVREQIDIVFKDFEEKIQKEIDACITENEIDDLITSL